MAQRVGGLADLDGGPSQERRRSRRYGLDLALSFKIPYATGPRTTYSGRTLNMSRHGMLFANELGILLRIGDLIRIEIAWPQNLPVCRPRELIVRGRIVRIKPGACAVEIRRFEFRYAPGAVLGPV